MEHFWEEIPGWFDYHDIYRYAVNQVPEGKKGTFVEIGSFMGKSTSFMAVEIANSKKDIDFYIVDPFEPFADLGDTDNWFRNEIAGNTLKNMKNYKYLGGSFYDMFVQSTHSISHYIKPLVIDSLKAHRVFEDESLDLVFSDGLHQYSHVSKELPLWYPKVKKGGIFAGHDYTNPAWSGVKMAVDEFARLNNLEIEFDGNRKTIDNYGCCWFMVKC